MISGYEDSRSRIKDARDQAARSLLQKVVNGFKLGGICMAVDASQWPGLVLFSYILFNHEPIIALQLKIISQGDKGVCHEDIAVLGQFCVDVVT